MKNLLSIQTALIRSLTTEGILQNTPGSMAWGGTGTSGMAGEEEEEEESIFKDDKEPTEIEKYAEALPDILDILIAERKVDRALELLEQGQQIVQLALNPQVLQNGNFTCVLLSYLSLKRNKYQQVSSLAPVSHGIIRNWMSGTDASTSD